MYNKMQKLTWLISVSIITTYWHMKLINGKVEDRNWQICEVKKQICEISDPTLSESIGLLKQTVCGSTITGVAYPHIF